jgi:hypothetical protein
MARNLAKELESIYQAEIAQIPAVHKTSIEGRHVLDVESAFQTMSALLTAQRNLIMRVADEIDELRSAIEGR